MAYRKPISPPEPTCSDVVECAVANPDPATIALLVGAAVLLLLVVTVAIGHITSARSLLDEERRRVAAEAEAFDEFASDVLEVDATGTAVTDGGPAGGGGTTALGTPPPDNGLAAVREAYRQTVMDVPHYEAEYDESLVQNMCMEFGADVAGAVDRGSTLTPQLKGTLVERSRTAHRQRRTLLRQLEAEGEELDDAAAVLSDGHRSAARIEDADVEEYPFDQLVAEWRLLGDRKETAESVIQDRQRRLHQRDRETTNRPDGPSFEAYLYGSMDVTHPVLAEATELVERIEAARRRVERAIASHP